MRFKARLRLFRRRGGYICVLCGAVLLACLVATHNRNNTWRSSVALWGDTVSKSPNKIRPLVNLGMSWKEAGDPVNAAAYFARAANIDTQSLYDKRLRGLAETNLAYIHIEHGEYDRAFQLANDAMAQAPTMETFNAMALLVLIGGNPEEAIKLTDEIFLQGGASWRLRSSVWATRGQAFQQLGDCNNAMAAYVAIKYLKPDFQIPNCP